jgi:hypothetical protein
MLLIELLDAASNKVTTFKMSPPPAPIIKKSPRTPRRWRDKAPRRLLKRYVAHKASPLPMLLEQ